MDDTVAQILGVLACVGICWLYYIIRRSINRGLNKGVDYLVNQHNQKKEAREELDKREKL